MPSEGLREASLDLVLVLVEHRKERSTGSLFRLEAAGGVLAQLLPIMAASASLSRCCHCYPLACLGLRRGAPSRPRCRGGDVGPADRGIN